MMLILTLLAALAPSLQSSALEDSAALLEPAPARQLRERLAALVDEHETIPGMAIHVVGAGNTVMFGAAAGKADPQGSLLTVDTPVRIASNTKTYTAATILRLWEQGRVDLDAPIGTLVDPALVRALDGFGYDTDAITVRHLLMHVSGMPDHADLDYVHKVLDDRAHEWTRAEQIAELGKREGPLAAPGELFMYSDSGYTLLGDIIERITESKLGPAVREQLGLDELGLACTWWEIQEPAPEQAGALAHQFLHGDDMHDVSATVDLYGGGGLVASTRDLALFMAALGRGEVFEKAETLQLMQSAPGHPSPDAYRIGLFPRDFGGRAAFEHSGFWGTTALYIPDLDVAIGGVVLDQSGFPQLLQAIRETVADLDRE